MLQLQQPYTIDEDFAGIEASDTNCLTNIGSLSLTLSLGAQLRLDKFYGKSLSLSFLLLLTSLYLHYIGLHERRFAVSSPFYTFTKFRGGQGIALTLRQHFALCLRGWLTLDGGHLA